MVCIRAAATKTAYGRARSFARIGHRRDFISAMADRRYNDDEIAEIFQKASESPQGTSLQRSGEEGLTLAELQEIGREAGISPEAVDRAARSLEVRPLSAIRSF